MNLFPIYPFITEMDKVDGINEVRNIIPLPSDHLRLIIIVGHVSDNINGLAVKSITGREEIASFARLDMIQCVRLVYTESSIITCYILENWLAYREWYR